MKRKGKKSKSSLSEASSFAPRSFGGWLVRAGVLALAAVITLLVCFRYTEWQEIGCFAAMVLASWEIFYATAKNIRTFPNDDLLFSLAIIICYFSGGIYVSVWIAAFLSVALLQRNALHRLSEQDSRFYDNLRHMMARVKEAKRHAFYDVETLPVGSLIEVFGGETIPTDGVIVNGQTKVDYSAWIGKQSVVEAGKGQPVYLGGVNLSMPVTVKITAHGENSVVQRMQHAAIASLSGRPTEFILIDRFCEIWSVLFLIAGVIYMIFDGIYTGWSHAFEKTAALWLIGTAGGVAFAAFSAAVCGAMRLSRYGVIADNFRKIALLRKISDVIFDKTGTLTVRELQISEIVPHNDVTKEQLLYFAALAEQASDHLIAKAILRHFGSEELPPPEHHLIVPGEGVCVVIKGKRIFVGNDKLMRRAGIYDFPEISHAIVCFVVVENMYAGCIVLNDPIKEGAFATVDDLFSLGIHSVDMITSDTKENADAVGTALGINRVFSELDMRQKEKVLLRQGKFDRKGGRIAFIGDDQSDALLMKAADISIAMKTLADDPSATVADIAVFSDDPLSVRHAFWLSRKLHRALCSICLTSLLIRGICFAGWITGFLPLWAIAGLISVGDLLCLQISDRVNRFEKINKHDKKRG